MKTRLPIVTIVAVACLAACGRSGGTAPAGAPPEPRGPEPAVATGAATPAPEAAASPASTRVPSSCPVGRTIEAGGNDTPEGVLWDAYRLAIGPDSEDAIRRFHGLFTDGTPESHVRRELWPRVREHVSKYVQDVAKPSYVVCRTQEMGTGRIKLFVRCNDPRKSDPPTVLTREGGVWKIDVMTP